MARTIVGLLVALTLTVAAACSRSIDSSGPPTTPLADAPTTTAQLFDPEALISVAGNQLVGPGGEVIQLRGFNLAGTEYACSQGWGIFDGPADENTLELMASWGGNAIRVLANEHCWLERNGVDPEFAGETYREALLSWVDLAREHGFYVVFSMIWSDAGENLAQDQAVMANTDHSLDFWASAAAELASRDGVILDLYGEPHDIDWDCWQSGCYTEEGYPAAGMQQLLDVVRDAGSTQPVIISGMEYANDLTGWLGYPVVDSIEPQQLIAGWHSYDFNRCIDPGCWNDAVASVAAEVPVIAVEFGGSTCDGTYVNQLMPWMDENGLSYLAWAWNPWDTCVDGPDLVLDFEGTPTGYGAAVRDHYLARQGS